MPTDELEAHGGGSASLRVLPPSGAAAQPFRFHRPRCLIDWRALHAVDLGAVARDTDLDALERVLDVLHGGDIEGEDARNLTPLNLVQLCRAAQLTLDYLLHVQERLAADSSAAQREGAAARHREQLLQLKVRELREELAGSRKEVRYLKKSARSFEALALARPQAPPPAPEVRVVERVVEVPDTAAAAKVAALQAQVAELAGQRQEMQRDSSKLADVLAAAIAAQAGAEASTARAVEAARREERHAAAERLQQALEKERRMHRDSSVGSPSLHSKLAAAQQREKDAEQRAEAAVLDAAEATARASTAAAAEGRRLRCQLDSVRAGADELRERLAQAQQREQESPSRGSSRRKGSSGLGAELEDADDAQLRQLGYEVEAQRKQLAASEAALAQATARCRDLEQQLWAAVQQQQQQPNSGDSAADQAPVSPTTAERAAAASVLEREAERLRGEKAALREECRRLRQQAAQDAVHIEHLSERLQQATFAQRGRSSQPASRSASPAKLAAAQGDGRGSGSRQQEQRASSARHGMASSPSVSGTAGHISSSVPSSQQRPGSRPASARDRQHTGSPTCLSSSLPPSPGKHSDAWLSAADRRQFRQELRHTLHSAERPGVVSRFPHSLGSFLALRPDLEEELEAELAAQLATFGLPPRADRLSSSQLEQALAELERRRGGAWAAMSACDRQRMDYMRRTAAWHVQRMVELAAGQRDASPVKRAPLIQAPHLKPIRTSSREEELSSPRRRGYVEKVLDEVGDDAAIYSPLARGASVLSDRGYFSPGATPRATSSPAVCGSPVLCGSPTQRQSRWGPQAADETGLSASPWALTNERVFRAGVGAEGSLSASPLAHGASQSRHTSPSPPTSAGASPVPWPRSAATHVQFSRGDGDEEEDHFEVQRVGKRSSFSQTAARGGAAPTSPPQRWQQQGAVLRGTEARLPTSRRLPKQGQEEIVPAERQRRDSRDWDTGEAAAVRPAMRYNGGIPAAAW
ncbi:Zinc finger protein Dzip1 [Chlorella vulgaris]